MNQEEFLFLATRKLSGEASPEEVKELERLIASEKELAVRYNLMVQYWNVHENPYEVDVESSLNKLFTRMETPVVSVRKRRSYRYLLAAASVAIIIAGAATLFFFGGNRTTSSAGNVAMVEKNNSAGTRSVLQLSDGSKIWLNADSRLQYPETFRGNAREVHL